MKAYLDNGATTQVAREVIAEMKLSMSKKFGNPSSLHSYGQAAKEELEKSRRIIAEALHAEPGEIHFTSGGTESDNWALRGVAMANKQKGSHIITSAIEHHAVHETCHQLEQEGYSVSYLMPDKGGIISAEKVMQAITTKTILVSIMHANNEIGTIEPLAEIGRVCNEKGVLFHTDAVQSFTKVPIDVNEMHLDIVSLSAHKIHGPKGIGALYIRKGTKIAKLFYGGPQEGNMRPGTENIPGIVGFAKAATLMSPDDIMRITSLRDELITGLLGVPDSFLNGARQERLCNNANISFRFVEGESLLLHLDSKGIAVSTGSACSSKNLKPSHVLLAIGLLPEEAHGSLRFTLSRYTTEKEIRYAIKATAAVVKKLRKLSPLGQGSKATGL